MVAGGRGPFDYDPAVCRQLARNVARLRGELLLVRAGAGILSPTGRRLAEARELVGYAGMHYDAGMPTVALVSMRAAEKALHRVAVSMIPRREHSAMAERLFVRALTLALTLEREVEG